MLSGKKAFVHVHSRENSKEWQSETVEVSGVVKKSKTIPAGTTLLAADMHLEYAPSALGEIWFVSREWNMK